MAQTQSRADRRLDREAFLQKCLAAVATYCEGDILDGGDREMLEACWHLAEEMQKEPNQLELGPVVKSPKAQVVYLDVSKVSEEVLQHLTGKAGAAPELYLTLTHVAVHCLVADNLPQGVSVVSVRLRGLPEAKIAGQLRAHDVASVICVRGTIVRLSSVQPLASKIAFTCAKCGDVQVCPTVDGVVTAPAQCPRSKCRGARRFGAAFNAEPLHEETTTVNHQRLKLQLDAQTTGRIPTSVEVELRGSLCDTASPGDIVTCVGILKQDAAGGKRRGPVADRSGLTAAYLQCNNIERFGPAGDVKDSNVITPANMAGIRAIAARPDAFALLVHSLCPIIVGHDLVKAGMLLTLFGGTPRSPESGQRGDTHMLVVGDPGAGKSQMLRAVSHVAPRGVLVSGNSASASGLTVTLVRDVATGDTALEAGALVLGDQGTTCIDEFDKMDKTEHQALLEAMEQQRISIAKAGAVGSLPARTSVIAAANPTSGHYDDLKSVAENVRTNPALLSRFDLVFIVKDTIGGIQQEGLTKHVLSLHAGRRNPDPPRPPAAAAAGAKEEVLSYTSEGMESRLLSRKYSDAELVPHKLITKYLSYAKRTVRPRLSPEASQQLHDYFIQLRKLSDSKDAMLITTRQLESLVRLAQARAKVQLRSVVTADDAKDVIDLMKRSLYQMCTDVETGQIDANRGPCGAGRSKDGRALVHWMRDEIARNDLDPSAPFSHRELVAQLQRWAYSEAKAEKTVAHLNAMGDILTTTGGYKLRATSSVATPAKKRRTDPGV